MNQASTKPTRNSENGDRQEKAKAYTFSMWKKILCGAAVIMTLTGAGLQLSGVGSKERNNGSPGNDRVISSGQAPGISSSFMPGDSPGTKGNGTASSRSVESEQEPLWGPALMRGGAGFLIGFGIGYALRTLLRISLAIGGFIMLAVVALNYFGWIDINWETIQHGMSQWGTVLQKQLSDFQTFLLGIFPSAGLGSVGLFSGFRKK